MFNVSIVRIKYARSTIGYSEGCNKDKDEWDRFWKFATTQHACLNHAQITITTDQKKGSIESMADVLPIDVNFFCSYSYHHGKNILTHVKGGKGEYSCYWY